MLLYDWFDRRKIRNAHSILDGIIDHVKMKHAVIIRTETIELCSKGSGKYSIFAKQALLYNLTDSNNVF